MSQELINHNEDLKRLVDEGYEIGEKDGYLLVHNVPYVDKDKKVCLATLVSTLTLSGNKTIQPDNHMCYFTGEQPYNADGSIITGINCNKHDTIFAGETIQYSFSSKPQEGYPDYYKKMVAYCDILGHQAREIDPNVSAKNHFQNSSDTSDDSGFCYPDTNSSRATISNITNKLSDMKVAIIGLGGTGSYLLDFLAKTKVKEIHLFDDDGLKNHNVFRMPGAVSKEVLSQNLKKVAYLKQTYSSMKKGIIEHECKITKENYLDQLNNIALNFVFICIDASPDKRCIIEYLLCKKIPFIDVGIEVLKRDGDSLLTATARTTFVSNSNTQGMSHISFADIAQGVYDDSHIQIAEVNALNATLAIIRWKKWAKIYENRSEEYNSCYDLSQNKILVSKC